VSPDTIAKWLDAGEFPERVRSNRLRDDAALLREAATGRILVQRSLSAGRIAALLVKPPRSLSDTQRSYLEGFVNLCPTVPGLRHLALQFRSMIRWHEGAKLRTWMSDAVASGFLFLSRLARGLWRDRKAVRMSITVPWSNGPIEGQINRLKCIKRQMYGRAGFELLKTRVLRFVEAATGATCTESA
jgi:hypothetical protein